MIGIIDYKMGNLRSVQKALERQGGHAVILPTPDATPGVDALDALILPGIGAFADGMIHLRERGWIEPIKSFIASGRPFLGVCLGMQLLFEGGEEDAPPPGGVPGDLVPGLGVLRGDVPRFVQPAAGPSIKIPHMGWNTLTWSRPDPLLAGLPQHAAVYFVHSYYCRPADPSIVSATAQYPEGRPFCASIWKDNIWATQFHPEKSQEVGQTMLRNFLRVSGKSPRNREDAKEANDAKERQL